MSNQPIDPELISIDHSEGELPVDGLLAEQTGNNPRPWYCAHCDIYMDSFCITDDDYPLHDSCDHPVVLRLNIPPQMQSGEKEEEQDEIIEEMLTAMAERSTHGSRFYHFKQHYLITRKQVNNNG